MPVRKREGDNERRVCMIIYAGTFLITYLTCVYLWVSCLSGISLSFQCQCLADCANLSKWHRLSVSLARTPKEWSVPPIRLAWLPYVWITLFWSITLSPFTQDSIYCDWFCTRCTHSHLKFWTRVWKLSAIDSQFACSRWQKFFFIFLSWGVA